MTMMTMTMIEPAALKICAYVQDDDTCNGLHKLIIIVEKLGSFVVYLNYKTKININFLWHN